MLKDLVLFRTHSSMLQLCMVIVARLKLRCYMFCMHVLSVSVVLNWKRYTQLFQILDLHVAHVTVEHTHLPGLLVAAVDWV
jgi:hypothetical protein